jgi:hypothetical protein
MFLEALNLWEMVGSEYNRFSGPRHHMAGESTDESIVDVSLGGPTVRTAQFADAYNNLNAPEEHLSPLGVLHSDSNTEWETP